MTVTATRRERQREATYAEIVAASRALLAEGDELSLRAVASRIGMTAPALYRYVASYQELVDLVAFEVDKAATETFRAAAEVLPESDAAGRLVLMVTEFRAWAMASPLEFGLVFANPVADAQCVRREAITTACSGHLMTDQLWELHQRAPYPFPALEDLPPPVRTAVEDPLMPAKAERIALEDRGLMWVWMRCWARLYGVVALEVFGHLDPRLIETGEMFLDMLRDCLPALGLEADGDRLVGLARDRLSRRP